MSLLRSPMLAFEFQMIGLTEKIKKEFTYSKASVKSP